MITDTEAFMILELKDLGCRVKEISKEFNITPACVDFNAYVKRYKKNRLIYHKYPTTAKTEKCTRCGVRKRRMPLNGKYYPVQYLVNGDWTHIRPQCKRKQIAFTSI